MARPPPQLSIPSGMQTYFSPNGDGQEDTATVDFCLFKNANVDASAKVDATVVDASGATVRTIESAADTSGSQRWLSLLGL